MGGSLLSLAAAASVFAAILLPPGYVLARLLRIDAEGLPRLVVAFGLGYSAVLTLLFALRGGAGPPVAVALAVASLVLLRPRGAALRAGIARLAPALVVPACLALLALAVNGRDLAYSGDGASLALGFDVSDRVFYAAVSQELERAGSGTIENPVFSGLPLQYAFFPCLSATLVHRLTGVALLPLWLVGLPALGLFLVALASQAVLEDWGVGPAWLRSASGALVVLGGDLSFLVAQPASAIPERFRHFFVFYPFSGECLYYNPWFLGVPLVLAAFVLARRFLALGTTGPALGAAFVIGTLWQTKAFAFLAIVAGSALYGLVTRRPRPLVLALLATLYAAPWAALALGSGSARGGAPLVPSFLYLVQAAVAGSPPLRSVALALGVDSDDPLARGAGIAAFTLLFLTGGLGLRLLGLSRLLREARRSASGVHGLVLATLAVLVAAGLFVEGRPTGVEGVQFLLLAQALLWLQAGPVIFEGVQHGGVRAALALCACVVAVLNPLAYAARKAAPAAFAPEGAPDRLRYEASAGELAACRFLSAAGTPLDRVVVPLSAPSDRYGARPLLVAVLADRRVVATANPFHVDVGTAASRAAAVSQLYRADSPASADAALDALAVRWVWVDDTAPLAAVPTRLVLRHREAGVSLFEVAGS